MANERRLYQNLLEGTTTVLLSDVGTTLTSAALASLVAIDATAHAILVLDPDRDNGDPELVKVTAHTASDDEATIERGYAGTVAREHAIGTTWRHVTVADDYPEDPVVLIVAIGDETTEITTGAAKTTFRMPFAMTLLEVRASLTTASSSGAPTFDVNETGASILSTKLSIDSGEKTSTTAATPPVISDPELADDAEVTIDVDTAGTGATGAKVYLLGRRP